MSEIWVCVCVCLCEREHMFVSLRVGTRDWAAVFDGGREDDEEEEKDGGRVVGRGASEGVMRSAISPRTERD